MVETQFTTKGSLFVIAAPSGAGKTSLIAALLEQQQGIQLSVSDTTRAPRPGEQHGLHYYFTDVTGFKAKITANEFLEHAQVFDNFYGTSLKSVQKQLDTGDDVILEIDWQGARQVKKRIPDCVSIFILPPSTAALQQRLSNRGQDSDDIISRRMSDAVSEMSHYSEFDYILINDDFEHALADIQNIMIAQQYRTSLQQHNLANILMELVE